MFQSTFPRGERRQSGESGKESGCFNPRSHKGNDLIDKFKSSGKRVSIHVPTRGTTLPQYPLPTIRTVSIHVPTRGTTLAMRGLIDTGYVSIHVPTRGTTSTADRWMMTHVFQSTFPQGERRPRILFRYWYLPGFNPRSHKGND